MFLGMLLYDGGAPNSHVPERACGAEAPRPQPSADRDRKCHVKSLKSGMVYHCSVTSPLLTEQSQPRGPLYIIRWLSIKGPIILFLCIRLTSGPIEEATVSFIDHIFPRCPQREEERAEGPRELLFHVLQPPRRMAAGRLSSPSGPFQAIVTAPDSPRPAAEKRQGCVSHRRKGALRPDLPPSVPFLCLSLLGG